MSDNPAAQHPVVLVTGASSGIGSACVRLFTEAGWDVFAIARRKERLEELAGEVRKRVPDSRIETARCDVNQDAELVTVFKQIRERFGRLDALINNAGYAVYGLVEDTPVEAFRENVETNYLAVLNCTKRALPLLRVAVRDPRMSTHPAIVMVSSIVGRRSFPGMTSYCASKFALEGLSEGLRLELDDEGISVSVINPSVTKTEFFDTAEGKRPAGYLNPGGGMSAEAVARRVVAAVRRPRRNEYLSLSGKAGVALQWLSPRLFDFLIGRTWKGKGGAPES